MYSFGLGQAENGVDPSSGEVYGPNYITDPAWYAQFPAEEETPSPSRFSQWVSANGGKLALGAGAFVVVLVLMSRR